MFSFFKFLQKFISDLKSKKGLWFTILAFLSVSGIFLSLYLLTHMTESVSKDVYVNMSSTYVKNYKNRVVKKEQTLKKIILTMKSNQDFISSVENNNLQNVGSIVTSFNNSYKENGFNSLQMSFYPVFNQVNQYRSTINSVINTKNKIFGIEVLSDGIYYSYIEPIISNDNLIGILELKEEIHDYKAEYMKDNLIFLFMIEERMLNRLSINARDGKYREVIDTLYVEEEKYDGQFFAKIIENGKDSYKQMLEDGYSVDDAYFRAVQKVADIEGNVIGLVVIGEPVEGSGAFVNIVDNMTKTVTTVALGLVISILLFMF
ncbi:hypothetical protein [Halarcobacter sp.]|uniref:hypothetical protein n=1 Tax=Halarcobacter sp. TaxID=2321133 RepID=UPI0029F4DC07|nr:hypothetical protein [Halarcobacter sp.]